MKFDAASHYGLARVKCQLVNREDFKMTDKQAKQLSDLLKIYLHDYNEDRFMTIDALIKDLRESLNA